MVATQYSTYMCPGGHINPNSQECQRLKFKKNPKFHFVKY